MFTWFLRTWLTSWPQMPDTTDEAFRILADPTRRRILDLLAERSELTVGEIAAEFPDLVSSGISKHLMAMRAAGLVVSQKRGRNQHYRISAEGFRGAMAPWIARYEQYWSGTLESLKKQVESGGDPTQSDERADTV